MRAVCNTKGPHVIAAPHNLPAKLLLRMRRQDRAATLASLDQPQVLRQLFSRFRQNASATTRLCDVDSFVGGIFKRTRLPAGATTISDRAAGRVGLTDRCNSITPAFGPGFYLRRAYEERQTVLAPRSWSSALLATQGPALDVAGGKVNRYGSSSLTSA
jgi:hypothetical protein